MCVRIDPNPRIVYATLWEAYRNGHSMSSGGKGSGMYKSIDGGDTWKSLNENQECQLNSNGNRSFSSKLNRLYALIENTKGGLYRSDDAGEHWELINEDKKSLAKTMVLYEFTS
jgi:photosystem II stability/assembly factor-like uncharacterized protein